MQRAHAVLVNRWLFAGLYLLLIPVFTALYAWRAGDFYSATATQEGAYQSAVEKVQGQLNRDLRAAAHQLTTTTTPTLGSASIAREDISVYGIQVPDDSHVTVDLRYTCRSSRGEDHVVLPLTVTTRQELVETPPKGPTRFGVRLQQEGVDRLCEANVGRLFGIQHLAGTDTVAYVSQPFLNLAAAIGRAKDGYLDGLPGRFGRAAYLSAVVVTTLGFGDVVPVTGFARGLISIEAVLGILFAGLFINAVSQTKSSSSGRRHERSVNGRDVREARGTGVG